MFYTVEWEIFTSKRFRQLPKWRKLIAQKLFSGEQLGYLCMGMCVSTVLCIEKDWIA